MATSYFPLRWESTGDTWWFAAPIDWAAAKGHFDLVHELLHHDPNLLIQLTSLRRIRRLETVWDGDDRFVDVAKCRSLVAQRLLRESELKTGKNSLIHAGYGGWLLYTAASAGDLDFAQYILKKDPLLVFGEGEYGVTDILYAAARGKNSQLFRLLFDFAVSPKCTLGYGAELHRRALDGPSVFKWELTNRAVHAAAKGGNLEALRELLRDCSDVLACRDAYDSTILHTASAGGQIEVVKDLVASYDIITSKDNHGNTALHVAASRGHLSVVEALIQTLPSSTAITNNAGDTFLHVAAAGLRTPGFQRLDQQIELMKQLVSGNSVNLRDIVNLRNNDGRTALHMAFIGSFHKDLVELLMSVPEIDINIRDINNMTPLDLLKQHPQTVSTEMLIEQLTSAGGLSNSHCMARSAIVSCLKMQGPASNPGTYFGLSDSEIILYTSTGILSSDNGNGGKENKSSGSSSGKNGFYHFDTLNRSKNKKLNSADHASWHLKNLLHWPRWKENVANCSSADACKTWVNSTTLESYKKLTGSEKVPIPLRQRFSKPSSLPNNKRTLSVRSTLPSPSAKKKFVASLMQGVVHDMPLVDFPAQSPLSPFLCSLISSPMPLDRKKENLADGEIHGQSSFRPSHDDEKHETPPKPSSASNTKLMNHLFCFGAHDLPVENSSMKNEII